MLVFHADFPTISGCRTTGGNIPSILGDAPGPPEIAPQYSSAAAAMIGSGTLGGLPVATTIVAADSSGAPTNPLAGQIANLPPGINRLEFDWHGSSDA